MSLVCPTKALPKRIYRSSDDIGEDEPENPSGEEFLDDKERRARIEDLKRKDVAAHHEEPRKKKARFEREKEAYERAEQANGQTYAQWVPIEIMVLENGGIIEHGSHDVLLAKGGRYAQLWNQQTIESEDLVSNSS
ncbi:hypothetical protein L7F22_017297 [Adiantum nelumboides]|nr:hypothetical protein [Adiantum nelumboides]